MSANYSLASCFTAQGDHSEWWPVDKMSAITPAPTGWVKIAERTPGVAHDTRESVLVPTDGLPTILQGDRSPLEGVGNVELYEGRFHDGLTGPFDQRAEFFCQVRWQTHMAEASVEWSWPFLWYWKAWRQGNRWIYLDSAGREVELARARLDGPDNYLIEVQAMALRHYLHRRHMALLLDIQFNEDRPEAQLAEREEHSFECDWASMELVMYTYDVLGAAERETVAIWLHGRYAIWPAAEAAGPWWRSREEPESYPDFIYGIDPVTGRHLTVKPTPENAGTDGGPGPHFWTRIFFSPDVLDRYLSEPARYSVSSTRIACLNVWGLSIGRTSDRLVEVDLYDLAHMPWREWPHWKAHNVPPAGGAPDEGKFRRERLNQIASSPDIARELRTALQRANEAAETLIGSPIWRPLPEPLLSEWQALHPPVIESRSAFQTPLLTLTKVLIESIDSTLLKSLLVTQPASGTQSLGLLEQYVTQLDGSTNAVQPLKALQRLRSKGGFAHFNGGSTDDVMAQATPDSGRVSEAFERMCRSITTCLDAITGILSSAGVSPTINQEQ